jgi:DNA-binding response OmpR family regulator
MSGNLVRLLRRATPFGHRRILLLEDDTSMHRLVKKVLRPLHVKVELFGNGRDVVARLAARGKRYDALLLDLMMPHDGGLTVLRSLRETQASLLERVILLTGSGRAATDAWSSLVFAIVHKPFDSPALLETVRACVEQRREKKVA